MSKLDVERIRSRVRLALEEDIGKGDITTALAVEESALVIGVLIAKQEGVLAGNPVAELVFKTVDPDVAYDSRLKDGTDLSYGSIVAHISGKAKSCLVAERVALNFLQRLSGIATLTREYVKRVQNTGARILDTRKTTPGLRYLEKYAVKVGGGENHRLSLDELILIKDNHIRAAGGVRQALRRVKDGNTNLLVEVEAKTLTEVQEAIEAGADRIMLDNMGVQMIQEAVQLVAGTVELEASGKVSLENVRAIAETGVQYISIGAITHSAPALDMSFEVQKVEHL